MLLDDGNRIIIPQGNFKVLLFKSVMCSCLTISRILLQAIMPNSRFSQTIGSVTTLPQPCDFCHKQYASRAKLMQHQRKAHSKVCHKIKYGLTIC